MQSIPIPLHPTTNTDADWNAFDAAAYHDDSYGPLIPEDVALTAAFIRCTTTHPELRSRMGTAHHAADACAGGVLRNAGLIYPLLRADATITLSDIGRSQLAITKHLVAEGRKGNLGIWAAHQEDMARHDPRWAYAITRACLKSRVANVSIFDLPTNEYDIITTAFGPESITADLDEYTAAMHSWLNSGAPGGLAVMSYMVGSSGYMVNGVFFPAIAVYPHDVEQVVRGRMRIIEHFVTPASGHAREANDPTHYDGIGLLVGIIT